MLSKCDSRSFAQFKPTGCCQGPSSAILRRRGRELTPGRSEKPQRQHTFWSERDIGAQAAQRLRRLAAVFGEGLSRRTPQGMRLRAFQELAMYFCPFRGSVAEVWFGKTVDPVRWDEAETFTVNAEVDFSLVPLGAPAAPGALTLRPRLAGEAVSASAGARFQKPAIWEQWGGSVQRGDAKSLVLFRLDPVHYHNVPDDDQPHKTKRIWVKAGTQIIDRVWGELRKHLGTRKPVNTKMLTNKLRSFQWLHWHRGEDLWLATGEMLEEAFLRQFSAANNGLPSVDVGMSNLGNRVGITDVMMGRTARGRANQAQAAWKRGQAQPSGEVHAQRRSAAASTLSMSSNVKLPDFIKAAPSGRYKSVTLGKTVEAIVEMIDNQRYEVELSFVESMGMRKLVPFAAIAGENNPIPGKWQPPLFAAAAPPEAAVAAGPAEATARERSRSPRK
ncbi:unnamed protein product [Prorocentrum cordatum]|uniref:Uncharacterized protein n=1 Tax=Prorocentrum cordatum TaxID=2364126 RepID=A0ABN9W6M3_9DINO|nr:unnamed protein product [Polarella glacialis]